MSLILHQLKTDLLHFRVLLGLLWLSFLAESIVRSLHGLNPLYFGLYSLIVEIAEYILAALLAVSLIQADKLVGADAGWLSRPLRRNQIFWAKSSFLVVGLFIPHLFMQSLIWFQRGYSFSLCLAATFDSLLFTAPWVLVVATLAGLTKNHVQFFLGVALLMGGLLAALVLANFWEFCYHLPKQHWDWKTLHMVIFLTVTLISLISWIALGAGHSPQVSIGLLVLGSLVIPMIPYLPRITPISPYSSPSAPLTLSLTDPSETTHPPGTQRLSRELLVSGIPAQQVAVFREKTATLKFHQDSRVLSLMTNPDDIFSGFTGTNMCPQQDNWFRSIRDCFPPDTLWLNNYGVGQLSHFLTKEELKNIPDPLPEGELDGKVVVDLYAPNRVAEIPLQLSSFRVGGGVETSLNKVLVNDGWIDLSLAEKIPLLTLDRDPNHAPFKRADSNSSYCTYVLYDPGLAEAILVPYVRHDEYYSEVNGEVHREVTLRYPYPALRERLTGVSAIEWLKQARLCVFAAAYAGTATLPFHSEHYQWRLPGADN